MRCTVVASSPSLLCCIIAAVAHRPGKLWRFLLALGSFAQSTSKLKSGFLFDTPGSFFAFITNMNTIIMSGEKAMRSFKNVKTLFSEIIIANLRTNASTGGVITEAPRGR
eukprot:GHVU01052881.1.p2 GENE.GHVU01052881.1~~GHVU01052881.1.p2  ORF type:complete len:110 (-),score=7.88 GHVU01052881.1:152-481(-)